MHEHQKYRYLIASLAAIAAAGVSAVSTDSALVASAHAATLDVEQRTVSYRDLDLTRPRDRDVLGRRVRRAVRQVCDPGSMPLMQAAVRRCLRETQADADVQVAQHVGAAQPRQAALRPGARLPRNP